MAGVSSTERVHGDSCTGACSAEDGGGGSPCPGMVRAEYVYRPREPCGRCRWMAWRSHRDQLCKGAISASGMTSTQHEIEVAS